MLMIIHYIIFFIGEGCFGTVWRGEVDGLPEEDSTTRVAIKTTKTNATDKDKKDLLNELSVMKILEPHSNVVRLLGCCTEKGMHRSYLPYLRQKPCHTRVEITGNLTQHAYPI